MNKTMKIVVMTLFYGFFNGEFLYAQSESEDNVLDVLNTTTVPAFVIMGVSNTEISRPANVKEFTASLQNATSGLTTLPVNYAIEFLVGKEKNILQQKSGPPGQNLSFSFGYTQDPMVVAENSSRVGAGFKFAIKKNTVPEDDTTDIHLAMNYAKSLALKMETQRDIQLTKMNQLKISATENDVELEEELFSAEQKLVQYRALQKESRGIAEVIKEGFFLDMAGGMVWDVPGNTIGDTYFSKVGIWFTGGVERKDCQSLLFIVRGVHEPKMMYFNASNEIQYQEVNSFDMGGKIALRAFSNRLDAGFEFIYRIRESMELENSSKLMLNVAYELGENDKLSFAIGKDFDNSVSKEGNLVSVINFIKSIGNVTH